MKYRNLFLALFALAVGLGSTTGTTQAKSNHSPKVISFLNSIHTKANYLNIDTKYLNEHKLLDRAVRFCDSANEIGVRRTYNQFYQNTTLNSIGRDEDYFKGYIFGQSISTFCPQHTNTLIQHIKETN